MYAERVFLFLLLLLKQQPQPASSSVLLEEEFERRVCVNSENAHWLNGTCRCLGCQTNPPLCSTQPFGQRQRWSHRNRHASCHNGGQPTPPFRLQSTKLDRIGNWKKPCTCPENTSGHCCLCFNGGTQITPRKCACPKKFTGTRCEEVRIHSCENGGHLYHHKNRDRCSCFNGFSGSRCETPRCWNDGKPFNTSHCSCGEIPNSFGPFCKDIPCHSELRYNWRDLKTTCHCSTWSTGPACVDWSSYFWQLAAFVAVTSLLVLSILSYYVRRFCKYGSLRSPLKLTMTPVVQASSYPRSNLGSEGEYKKLTSADTVVKDSLPEYIGPGAPKPTPPVAIDTLLSDAELLFEKA